MVELTEYLKSLDAQIAFSQQAIERAAKEAKLAELQEARLNELAKIEWSQLGIDLKFQSKDQSLDDKKFLWASADNSLYLGMASLRLVLIPDKQKRLTYNVIISNTDRDIKPIEIALSPWIVEDEVRWLAAPSEQKSPVPTKFVADMLIRELARFYVKAKSAPQIFKL